MTLSTTVDATYGDDPANASQKQHQQDHDVIHASVNAQVKSVKDAAYGAKGDGTTDDTAAIQSALNGVPAGGGTIYFPPGTYKVTSMLTVAAGTVLRGAVGTKITGNLGTIMSAASGVTVYDLWIDNTNSSGCIGIDIPTNVTNVRVSGCKFTGANAQAVNVNATGVAHVTVIGCRFEGTGYGFLSNVSATDLTDVRIIGNAFVAIPGDPIEFNHPSSGSPTARNFTVVGNYINPTGASSLGVGVAGAKEVTISGNTFEAAANQAVHIEDTASRVAVVGNTFNNCVTAVWAIDGAGHAVNNNVITGGTTGIQFTYDASHSVTRSTVNGNTITGCSGVGINVASDVDAQWVVSGNMVAACGSHGISIGTSSSGSPGDISVSGNTVVNNTGAGFSVTGRAGMAIKGNVASGNAGGNFVKAGTNMGFPIGDLCTYQQIATSGGTSPATAIMPLGVGARGTVTVGAVRSDNGSQYVQGLYDLTWDGTTLTATAKGSSSNGAVSIGLTQSGGNLLLTITYATNNTFYVTTNFVGEVLIG